LVREARKFGVHIVLVSQNPMHFSRQYKDVRENTVNVFMHGEYFGYASKFLDDKKIQELDQGEAIIHSMEYSKLRVDVRKAFTLPTSPTEDEIKGIKERFSPTDLVIDESVSIGSPQSGGREGEPTKPGQDLDEDQEKLVSFVKEYIRDNDERPTYSKCYREGPFGSSKTKRLLGELVEVDVLRSEEQERYGNQSTVYIVV
jgi:hypothetical protein